MSALVIIGTRPIDLYNIKISNSLLKLASKYPVVTLLGPRQSGKSTLAQRTFESLPYANLEDPEIRHLALTDPRHFLNQYPSGAILDEIQNAPELLSYIQVIVDKSKQNGMFILTSSHQLSLDLLHNLTRFQNYKFQQLN